MKIRLCSIILLLTVCTLSLWGQSNGLYIDNCAVTLKGNIHVDVTGNLTVSSDESNHGIRSLDAGAISISGNLVGTNTHVLKDFDFTHLIFSGSDQRQEIILNNTIEKFHKLTLNNQHGLKLNNPISVNDTLHFHQGNLDLNGQSIDFVLRPIPNSSRAFGDGRAVPFISNENDDHKIAGEGHVYTYGAVLPSLLTNGPYNFANLGFAINQPTMTSIRIRRGNEAQTIENGKSVSRYFDITSDNPDNAMADLEFHYLLDELPSLANAEHLNFNRHPLLASGELDPNGTWVNMGRSTYNTQLQAVSLNQSTHLINQRWTLHECDNPEINIDISDRSVCAGETIELKYSPVANTTFRWSTGDTTANISITRQTPGIEIIGITVTRLDGCFSDDTLKLIFSENPSITIEQNTIESCLGNTIELAPSIVGDDPEFRWSTGDTSAVLYYNVDEAATAQITLDVTISDGCSTEENISITGLATPMVNLGADTSYCNKSTLTLDAGAGNNYNYFWMPGMETSQQITISGLDHYAVTVTDQSTGCQASDSVTIGLSRLFVTRTTKNPTCRGTDGEIALNIQRGTDPYAIRWAHTPDTSRVLTGLQSGEYSVTITDAVGCQKVFSSIKLKTYQPLDPKFDITHDSCHAGAGQITVHPQGGNPPYAFKWFNNEGKILGSQKNLSNLLPGTYILELTDASNCAFTRVIVIQGPVSKPSYEIEKIDIQCDPQISQGIIQLTTIEGGTPPYKIRWSNGDTIPFTNHLDVGMYQVAVTDAVNCVVVDTSIEIVVSNSLLLSETYKYPTCIGNNDGEIEVNVFNYMGPVDYQWNTDSSGNLLTNLSQGDYTVTATTDIPSCTGSMTVSLAAPQLLSVSLDSVTLSSCEADDGAIYITPFGGSDYRYNWSHDGIDTLFDDPEDITNLTYGQYHLTLTDNNSCVLTKSYTLGTQAPLVLDLRLTYNNCNTNNAANILSTAHGGIGGLKYLWSTGDTSTFITNLSPGDYSVTVTDEAGCSISKTIQVEEIGNLSVDVITNTPRCLGDTSAIQLQITGGLPPYTYYFNHYYNSLTDLSYAPAGNYTIYVEDSQGCAVSQAFELVEANKIAVDANITPASSAISSDGSISLTPVVGTPPFTFEWQSGQQTNNLENINSGTYVATVTDANGCASNNLFWHVPNKDELIVLAEVEYPSCPDMSDGSIHLFIENNAPPFIYEWSTGDTTSFLENIMGGIYSVQISNQAGLDTIILIDTETAEFQRRIETTDANCTTNQTGEARFLFSALSGPMIIDVNGAEHIVDSISRAITIDNLAVGMHPYTLTSSAGCVLMDTLSIESPTPLAIDLEVSNIIIGQSTEGMAQIHVLSGTSPYDYHWSNGYSGQAANGLQAGNHEVTVTDAAGCEVVHPFSIQTQTALSNNSIVMDNSCGTTNDGRIELIIEGGIPPYRYQWNTGDTTSIRENLSAGRYYATVTDDDGQSLPMEFLVRAYDKPEVVANVKAIRCAGANDGQVTLDILGNTNPYTIEWSDGNTEFVRDDLAPGIYSYTVIDRLGCATSYSFELENPDTIKLEANITSTTSSLSADGSIMTTVSGGIQPYSLVWNNGYIGESLTDIPIGLYTLDVVDMNGCHLRDTFHVMSNIGGINDLTVLVDSAHVKCAGSSDGAIALTIQGGMSPYKISWNTGDTSQAISNLSAGDYSVTITDALDSMLIREISIVQPNPLIAEVDSITDDFCNSSSGGIILNVMGGTEPYTFNWSSGSQDQNLASLSAGNYNVTVTDINSCMTEASFEVQARNLTARLHVRPISCFEAEDGMITVIVDGASGALAYDWNTGDNTASIEAPFTSVYEVTVTDESGCVIVLDTMLEEPDLLVANITTIQNPGCDAGEQGILEVNVSGGTSPYAYSWSNGQITQMISDIPAGDYTVTATDANGCIAKSNTTLQGASGAIQARFFAASPVNSGDTVQFIDVSYPIPVSRQWYFGDPQNQSSTEEDPQFIYPFNGSESESVYSATLIVSSGECVDTLTKEIRVINTRSNGPGTTFDPRPIVTQIKDLQVYPNPTDSDVNIVFLLNQKDDVDLSIYNNLGQRVFHKSYEHVHLVKEYVEDLDLGSDMYIIQIVAGKDMKSEKLVITRK